MKHISILLVLVLTLVAGGCSWPPRTSMPMFSTPNEGGERRAYLVVGRVVDSFQKPVAGCEIYLTKKQPPYGTGRETVQPVALTDKAGNYSFAFELAGATNLYLYLDARAQGYMDRYIDIGYLLRSRGFQYDANNPVIVNAVLEWQGE